MEKLSKERAELVFGKIGFSIIASAAIFFFIFLLTPSSRTRENQRIYRESADAEVATVDGLMNGFSAPQDSSEIEPARRLAGRYLVWVTGPYKEDAKLVYHGDEDTAFPARDGVIFHNPFMDTIDYQKPETPGYVVIARTYAEYQTSADVTITTESPFGHTLSSKGAVNDTACSVVATVVDTRTKAIVARRDFPHPSKWREGWESVNDWKLSEVSSWLRGLGLQESDWESHSGQLK
jgi:hypothetical protein